MINIRLYMPSDTTGMVLLWNKAVSDGDSFIQDEALPYIQAGRFFANQNAAVVATDETGMVRGMYTIRSKYSGRCKHICSVVIAVDSEYRRRHIGEKLLNDCINRAASLGFKVIELYPVSASNKAAAALFEKAGFTKTGSIPNGFARGDGQFTDADTYCITLPDHVNEAVNMPGMQPDKGIALRPDERKVEMPGQAAFTGAQIPETGQPMPAAQNMQTQGQLPPVGMNGYTWKSSQGSFTSGQPVQANGNYQRPDPAGQNAYRQNKPDKSISSINIVFGAGVLLLTIAAAVFISVSWQLMGDVARSLALIAVLAVVFALSYLSGSVLKLKQTGFAFYTLGSLLTPILIVGMGALNLLGGTLSFSSGNGFLVTALGMLAFSVVTFIGSRIYESSAYFGMTYFGFTWMTLFLGVQMGKSFEDGNILVSAAFTADLLAFLVMTAALFEFSAKLKFFRIYANIISFIAASMTLMVSFGMMLFLLFEREVNVNAVVMAIGLLICTIVFIEGYKVFEKGLYIAIAYVLLTSFVIFAAYLIGTAIGDEAVISKWRAILVAIDLLALITATLSLIKKTESIRYFAKYAFLVTMASFVLMISETRLSYNKIFDSSIVIMLMGALASSAAVFIFGRPSQKGIVGVAKYIAPFSSMVTISILMAACNYIFDIDINVTALIGTIAFLIFRMLFVIIRMDTLFSDIAWTVAAAFFSLVFVSDGADILYFTMLPFITAAYGGFSVIRKGDGRREISKLINSLISGIFSMITIMLLPWHFIDDISAMKISMAVVILLTVVMLISRIKRSSKPLVFYMNGLLISSIAVSFFGMIIFEEAGEEAIDVFSLSVMFTIMMGLLVTGTVMGTREKKKLGVAFKSSVIATLNSMIFLFASISDTFIESADTENHPAIILMLVFLIISTVMLRLIPFCSNAFGTITGIIDSLWILIGAGVLCEQRLLLAVFAIAVAITIFLSANRLFTVVPIIVAIFALGNQINDIGLSAAEVNIIILLAAATCAVAGRVIFKGTLGGRTGIDYLAFSPALMVFFMDNADNYAWMLGLTLLAAMFFNLIGRTTNGDKAFASVGLCFVALSLMSTSEFIDYPEGMLTEFYICIVLALVLSIRYLVRPWTDEHMELVWFITVAIALIVEGFSAAETGYISDLLITGCASFGIFIYAFIVKSKKWFILGLVSILLIAVYLSATFWASFAWMLYLLIAGIVLIVIAAMNEWGRRHAADGERKRFFEEWKW